MNNKSKLILISQDRDLIEKAYAFWQENNVIVEVVTPAEWNEKYQNIQQSDGIPSLIQGLNASNNGDYAKILPFPNLQQGGKESSASGEIKNEISTINQVESVAIKEAIFKCKGNLTEAAKALGIGRATLYRKVKQYQIDPTESRKQKKAA